MYSLSIDDEDDTQDEVEPVCSESGEGKERDGVEEIALPVRPLFFIVALVEFRNIALAHPVTFPDFRR